MSVWIGVVQISNKDDASENWVNKDLKVLDVTKYNLKLDLNITLVEKL